MGLRGCAKAPDPLTHASASAERLWKTVEDKLGPAVQAARARRIGPEDRHVQVLTDCIALHMVRSIHFAQVHRSAAEATLRDAPAAIVEARHDQLAREFHRRHGIHPAGTEALSTLVEAPVARWRDHYSSGVLGRLSTESMFIRISYALRQHTIELRHPQSGHELVISDSPAFSCGLSTTGALTPWTPIGDAHFVGMPIAPDCLVVVAPQFTVGELTPKQVELSNRLQLAQASPFVYCRPGSAQCHFLAHELDIPLPASR